MARPKKNTKEEQSYLVSLEKYNQALAESTKTISRLNAFLDKFESQPMNLSSLEQSNGQFAPLSESSSEEKTSSPLDSLELANGQVEETAMDRVKKLEKVLCTAQTNPFGTTEFSIFEQNLDGMTVASMQSLAQRVGVNPWGSLPVLKQDLKTAFIHSNKQGTMKPPPRVQGVKLDPNDPKHLKVMQALNMKVG